MNTKQVGDANEVETMLGFLKLGFNVLTPYGDREKYDFVADVYGGFYKIQCKSSRLLDNDTIEFNCRRISESGRKTRRYEKGEIDFFATCYNGKVYLVPLEECGCVKRLRLAPTKNCQERGICWAKDYELGEVVKALSPAS